MVENENAVHEYSSARDKIIIKILMEVKEASFPGK